MSISSKPVLLHKDTFVNFLLKEMNKNPNNYYTVTSTGFIFSSEFANQYSKSVLTLHSSSLTSLPHYDTLLIKQLYMRYLTAITTSSFYSSRLQDRAYSLLIEEQNKGL